LVSDQIFFLVLVFRDAGHTYGKLQPWAVGSLGLASESESDFLTKEKKNNIDFALWKVLHNLFDVRNHS
jgi:cysteinyl-tRNA synthetase